MIIIEQGEIFKTSTTWPGDIKAIGGQAHCGSKSAKNNGILPLILFVDKNYARHERQRGSIQLTDIRNLNAQSVSEISDRRHWSTTAVAIDNNNNCTSSAGIAISGQIVAARLHRKGPATYRGRGKRREYPAGRGGKRFGCHCDFGCNGQDFAFRLHNPASAKTE